MKLHLLASFLSLATTTLHSQTLSITSLRIDHRLNPLGMDEPSPGLSWQILADEKSVTQSHYQIIVSEDIVSVIKGIGTSCKAS
jgi:alpha-L-rhamnosidase